MRSAHSAFPRHPVPERRWEHCIARSGWLFLALAPVIAAAQDKAAEPRATPPATVMACGLAFELPVEYRITKPRRAEGAGGMGLCSFDVVPAKKRSRELECKARDEGGSPPYKVCDWTIGDGNEWPTVQVARTRIDTDHQSLGPFQFEDGAWQLPNAYRGFDAAERFRFFGKRAYRGEVVTRIYWVRTRVKEYESSYAGAGGVDAVLVQLTPHLAVALAGPPTDTSTDGVTECRIFCQSLRAAGRPGDEP